MVIGKTTCTSGGTEAQAGHRESANPLTNVAKRGNGSCPQPQNKDDIQHK